MVSFDVSSLFTSVDLDSAKATVAELLDNNGTPTGSLEEEDLCRLLDLCLITHFEFNGEYYEPLRGTPTGSPIPGFIAEVTMRKLEKIVLPDINPKIWIRYVDDIFVIIKRSEPQRVSQLLNVFDDIKFTTEGENNGKLAFLGILITRLPNGQLQIEVYAKTTHTGQILSCHSNHPNCHKRICIRTLFKRIETPEELHLENTQEAKYDRCSRTKCKLTSHTSVHQEHR